MASEATYLWNEEVKKEELGFVWNGSENKSDCLLLDWQVCHWAAVRSFKTIGYIALFSQANISVKIKAKYNNNNRLHNIFVS